MQTGKTIAAKRERVTSDSERERVRRLYAKRKAAALLAVVLLGAGMVYLVVRVGKEWVAWMSQKTEVIVMEPEPSVEVIDENTGKRMESLSSRVKELVVQLEEEMTLVEHKLVRVRVPADKMRELDLEVEGFDGVIKVSLDRSAAVSAEDAARMIKYLENEGVETVEYVDVRVERKAFWK